MGDSKGEKPSIFLRMMMAGSSTRGEDRKRKESRSRRKRPVARVQKGTITKYLVKTQCSDSVKRKRDENDVDLNVMDVDQNLEEERMNVEEAEMKKKKVKFNDDLWNMLGGQNPFLGQSGMV